MKKLTLKFATLTTLTSFTKNLSCGYLLNTNNLTVTGKIPAFDVAIAIEIHQALLIETTDKVYSYDLLN